MCPSTKCIDSALPLLLRSVRYCCSGVRRKFTWGVHSVACGGHLYLVCAVRDVTVWRHIHVSKSTFCRSCSHNMHILLHALSLIYVSLHWM